MTSRSTLRVLSVVAATALAVSLAACGSSGPRSGGGKGDAGGTGEAKVWALQDPALNPIQKTSLKTFSDGGKKGSASLQTFANDPYKQKLRVALGSPNAPDVFFNWGGGNLKQYVDAGKVADLTPLLDGTPGLKEAFIPSVLDAAKIDGKYYGLPMRGVQPVALFYNKKVFRDAGVQPPKSWDDLLKLVDVFKSRNVTPIALAGSQAWTELMWAEYLLDRRGGPQVFQAIRDGKAEGWRDPAVLQSLSDIRTLVDRGGFGTKFASVGYDVGGASTLLAQGRAAMHLMGSWEYVNQLSTSPKFVKADDLGWVPFPSVSGGKGDPKNVVGNPTNFYSITAGSKVQQTAKDYLASGLKDPAYVEALVKAGDVPAVTGVKDKLATTDNADYTTWVYDLVQQAPGFQLSWDQDLPSDQATKMLTQLQKLFLGDVTPQQVVDAMAAG
jgi:xylobiose transport system substrate-binding protein